MRADRLLSILLLLQTQRQITTRQLAERLEVSPRTIHRDMDALSATGVPVVAERGVNGGWSLVEDYHTRLNGLNEAEIRALFLMTPAQLLADLGLRRPYESARLKLQAALPTTQQADADDLHQRVHIDLPGWQPSPGEAPCFGEVQAAVFQAQRVGMVYERGDSETVERVVDPLGLVAKGRVWYLVAAVEGEPRTYRISRITHITRLEATAERPPGFNLAQYWAQSSAAFAAALPRYPARLRIHPAWIERVPHWWRFGHVEQIEPPDSQGWCVVHVRFEILEEAAGSVLSCGPYAEVLAPEELRALVLAWAAEIVRRAAPP